MLLASVDMKPQRLALPQYTHTSHRVSASQAAQHSDALRFKWSAPQRTTSPWSSVLWSAWHVCGMWALAGSRLAPLILSSGGGSAIGAHAEMESASGRVSVCISPGLVLLPKGMREIACATAMDCSSATSAKMAPS